MSSITDVIGSFHFTYSYVLRCENISLHIFFRFVHQIRITILRQVPLSFMYTFPSHTYIGFSLYSCGALTCFYLLSKILMNIYDYHNRSPLIRFSSHIIYPCTIFLSYQLKNSRIIQILPLLILAFFLAPLRILFTTSCDPGFVFLSLFVGNLGTPDDWCDSPHSL